ncbi:MAG: lamin tail domain-containing protein, partial [Micromonosporaceae bacterium]|nr:lamin tail domain-containing protein [Micromonosporaceae bacterium]
HTDDTTGHRLEAEPGADQSVRIVAALVNPAGEAQAETVTLLNTTAAAIDLAGWTLLDRDKNALPLSGTLPAGETVRIPLRPPVMLPNKGGLITLLTSGGLRVDGVSYTAAAAKRRGCSTKF